MAASGKATQQVADWISSQLDMKAEIEDVRLVGPARVAQGIQLKDFRGERTILRAQRLTSNRPSADRVEIKIEGAAVDLADEATAADTLAGLNKLLRSEGLGGFSFTGTGVKLTGASEIDFSDLDGAVRIDGKNIQLDAKGTGNGREGMLTTLSLKSSLEGRDLRYEAELSRKGEPFIMESLLKTGELGGVRIRDFSGNQIVRKSDHSLTETFKEGTAGLNLLGFYRRSGLADSFNSFDKSYIKELVLDKGAITSFDLRVLATPTPEDRKVFSRRFLYTAHYLMTGKCLVAPGEKEELPFRELSLDVAFADGRYTLKGQLSVDGHWVLLDEMSLNDRAEVPPVSGAILTPQELTQRWTTAIKFNKDGWPQPPPELLKNNPERAGRMLEFAAPATP